jgi:hypothetical protein
MSKKKLSVPVKIVFTFSFNGRLEDPVAAFHFSVNRNDNNIKVPCTILLRLLVVNSSMFSFIHVCEPVLRIHDILVRFRIRGSMPLNNGSGFGS